MLFNKMQIFSLQVYYVQHVLVSESMPLKKIYIYILNTKHLQPAGYFYDAHCEILNLANSHAYSDNANIPTFNIF